MKITPWSKLPKKTCRCKELMVLFVSILNVRIPPRLVYLYINTYTLLLNILFISNLLYLFKLSIWNFLWLPSEVKFSNNKFFASFLFLFSILLIIKQ